MPHVLGAQVSRLKPELNAASAERFTDKGNGDESRSAQLREDFQNENALTKSGITWTVHLKSLMNSGRG